MYHLKKMCAVCCMIAIWLLSGCSPAGPRLIAAYPSTPAPRPPQPMDRDEPPIGYSSDLRLFVHDVDQAAREAARLARSYGGYADPQAGSRWGSDRIICLRLVVPAENKEYLRSALYQLGSPVERRDWWSALDNPCQRCRAEAVIHLELRPQTWVDLPDSPVRGWDPIWTLRRAWAVAASIFAFVVDALIWIVVVAGPFVLIGLGIWKLLQHLRRS